MPVLGTPDMCRVAGPAQVNMAVGSLQAWVLVARKLPSLSKAEGGLGYMCQLHWHGHMVVQLTLVATLVRQTAVV
jgi:hypothetical protein